MIGETHAAPVAEAEDDFWALADKITRETSFRCASYKDKCLRRRIAVRMRARGAASFSAYADVLDSDREEYQRLLDTLTVNVTRFFRDLSTYDALAANVLPVIWRERGDINVWSAGSASGEEAFSLAALFQEHAERDGDPLGTARVHITGSDIDRASLDAAERARYAESAFTETSPERLDAFFPCTGGTRTVTDRVRALAHFERRDILREPVAARSFHLIVCRNVIIYLDRVAQEDLLCSFYDALRPGGYLVLGRVETVLGRPRQMFRTVDLRERIYRKPS